MSGFMSMIADGVDARLNGGASGGASGSGISNTAFSQLTHMTARGSWKVMLLSFLVAFFAVIVPRIFDGGLDTYKIVIEYGSPTGQCTGTTGKPILCGGEDYTVAEQNDESVDSRELWLTIGVVANVILGILVISEVVTIFTSLSGWMHRMFEFFGTFLIWGGLIVGINLTLNKATDPYGSGDDYTNFDAWLLFAITASLLTILSAASFGYFLKQSYHSRSLIPGGAPTKTKRTTYGRS